MDRLRAVKYIGGLTSLAGLAVALGWILDIHILKSFWPGAVEMKFTASVSFILSGMVLLSIALIREKRSVSLYYLMFILVFFLVSLHGSLLVASLFRMETGIENLFLIQDRQSHSDIFFPGRPSFGAMLGFNMVSLCGIWFIFDIPLLCAAMTAIGTAICALGVSALVGYAAGIPWLFYSVKGFSNPIAANAAALFILLGLGLIILGRDRALGKNGGLGNFLAGQFKLRNIYVKFFLALIIAVFILQYNVRIISEKLVHPLFPDHFEDVFDGLFLAGLLYSFILVFFLRPLIAEVKALDLAEKRIREDEDKFMRKQKEIDDLNLKNKAILQSVPDIIMEVDANKIYTWANRAGYEFFGDDVLGKEAKHFFVGEQTTYDKVRPIFEGREDLIYVESWQRRRDGRTRLLAWWSRVIKDAGGAVTGVVSTARDITEFKEMEEAKNKLIRNISHSVKTPIAMTETAINLIRYGIEEKDDEQVRLAGAIASRNIGKVRRDIGNMLSLFVIDMKTEYAANKTPRGSAPKASLYSAVRCFTDDIAYLLQKKGIKVETAISGDADDVPISEKDLKIVLENILDNALKFTDKGIVNVKSRRLEGRLEIEVADTGCGLEAGEKDRIFEKFYKHDVSTEGIGLGLAICKEIINGYGGTIEAFSEGPDRGTAVIIKLPDQGV